jgi:hypothetical protein
LNYSRKEDLGVFFEELDVELLKPAQHINDHGLRRQDCGPAIIKNIKTDTGYKIWQFEYLSSSRQQMLFMKYLLLVLA